MRRGVDDERADRPARPAHLSAPWAWSLSEPRELDIGQPACIACAVDVLTGGQPVVLLQLPSVYALLAPPNARGVALLDGTKRRLPGKNYGSAVGDDARFHALAARGALPSALSHAGALQAFHGAFVRFAIAAPSFSSAAVRAGTHQGLLLPDGPHRALLRALEAALVPHQEPALFGGHAYSSVLCTSANMSGDPLGSITDEARARTFARARNVQLWIRCEEAAPERGSYPIFELHPERVTLERDGPRREEIVGALPPGLRPRFGGSLR